MSIAAQIERIVGERDAQTELIEQIKDALKGKGSGGSSGITETWTFIMEDGSEVTKDVVVA